MRPIRVLVVDDSAFARKVLRKVLAAQPDIEVVGFARDGLEALEKIAELAPDVITLDLVMPNLDGIGVLRALPKRDAPRVVLVSISDGESELALTALQLGAIDLVSKPTALATDRLYELGDELVHKVRAAARARAPSLRPAPAALHVTRRAPSRYSLVVLGTSTGGPQAITHFLSSLPADFPLPIAIALHIPAGYTTSLARRLDESCAIAVSEATAHLALRPGLAVLAPGGQHLTFERHGTQLRAMISSEPRDTAHAPSVDVLFHSAVAHCGGAVIGIVLTGMGDDGCRGAGAIRAQGGLVLTESADSCVVYGMPRCVVEAGFSSAETPLSGLTALLLSKL